jgi:hypothetical protein
MNITLLEATANALLPNFLQKIINTYKVQTESQYKLHVIITTVYQRNFAKNKQKNCHTNLSGIWSKYTIKCKSSCNFIYWSLFNNNFPVVGAVDNVNRLHAFFKCIQGSGNTGNIISHINVSTANVKHQTV